MMNIRQYDKLTVLIGGEADELMFVILTEQRFSVHVQTYFCGIPSLFCVYFIFIFGFFLFKLFPYLCLHAITSWVFGRGVFHNTDFSRCIHKTDNINFLTSWNIFMIYINHDLYECKPGYLGFTTYIYCVRNAKSALLYTQACCGNYRRT
jgi:hypothetical protein